jgi:hypothetical protein
MTTLPIDIFMWFPRYSVMIVNWGKVSKFTSVMPMDVYIQGREHKIEFVYRKVPQRPIENGVLYKPRGAPEKFKNLQMWYYADNKEYLRTIKALS